MKAPTTPLYGRTISPLWSSTADVSPTIGTLDTPRDVILENSISFGELLELGKPERHSSSPEKRIRTSTWERLHFSRDTLINELQSSMSSMDPHYPSPISSNLQTDIQCELMLKEAVENGIQKLLSLQAILTLVTGGVWKINLTDGGANFKEELMRVEAALNTLMHLLDKINKPFI